MVVERWYLISELEVTFIQRIETLTVVVAPLLIIIQAITIIIMLCITHQYLNNKNYLASYTYKASYKWSTKIDTNNTIYDHTYNITVEHLRIAKDTLGPSHFVHYREVVRSKNLLEIIILGHY